MSCLRLRYIPSKPSAGNPIAMIRLVIYVKSRLKSPVLRRFLLVETRARTQLVEQQLLPLLDSLPFYWFAAMPSAFVLLSILLLLLVLP